MRVFIYNEKVVVPMAVLNSAAVHRVANKFAQSCPFLPPERWQLLYFAPL